MYEVVEVWATRCACVRVSARVRAAHKYHTGVSEISEDRVERMKGQPRGKTETEIDKQGK